jgi:hypothetical protein
VLAVAVVQALAEWRSQRWLARLMDQFGTPGLAAALTVPGVAAVVDQHAAAVRDILLLGVEGSAVTAGVVLLAAYARGLLDQVGADLAGVAFGVSGRWPQADWLTLRLLGVCELARSVMGTARPLGSAEPGVNQAV